MTPTRIATATLLLLSGALLASVPLIQAAAKRTGQEAENACLDTYNGCYTGCKGKDDSCYTRCDNQYQQCMSAAGVVFAKLKKHPPAAPPTSPVLDKDTISDREKKLVRTPNAKDRIMAKLPKGLKKKDRAHIEVLVTRSLAATRRGDGLRAAQDIRQISAIALDNDGESPWQSCGAKCRHHLDDGNAPAYATCYWACVIWGQSAADSVIR